ncbi:MAG: type IV pilus twitching motility protein PilT [Gammaproteobacteria bacterium]|nr:type IV pilus twitching motility protein PilT [Gammaproteobacteria bacterium]
MNLNELLNLTLGKNASDLHLTADAPPWVRIDGSLQKLDLPAFTGAELAAMLKNCMDEPTRNKFTETWEVDFTYQLQSQARFRVNIYRQNRGIAAAFRTIATSVQSLDELQLPQILKDLVMLPRGLVLVTGPTGCGKSTTLASMIEYVNNCKNDHIITIEDPIEYLHSSKKCLINQREVHHDTKSFNMALRSALREDPDIILVGEMRDLETIRLALTAAETGHLVFATLHTLSAVKTIARIIDVFPGDEQPLVRAMLSESLQAVISQTLVKRVDGGRIAATEVMVTTTAVRNLIREDKLPQAYSVIQTGMAKGMHTLDQDLERLVADEVIANDIAADLAHDRIAFSGE